MSFPTRSLILSWAVFIACAAFSLAKPLTMDQAWPVARNAGAIASFGFDELGSGQLRYEIAHPTLYHHLLAGVFRLLGETDASARLLGVFCFFGVSWLLLQICLLIDPSPAGRELGAIAVFIHALSPFVIQFSLLVDQTTTLLPLFSLLFVYLVYFYDFRLTKRSAFVLGSSFALCLWAHESFPLLLLFALGTHLWTFRDLKASLKTCLVIGALGLGMFSASWALYSWLTKVSMLSFVEFSVLNKLLDPTYGSGRTLGEIAERAWSNGRWLSPAFVVLLGLAGYRRLAARQRGLVASRSLDYLWWYVIVNILVTYLYWNQLTRYQFVLYPMACVLVAAELQRHRRAPGGGDLRTAAAVGAAWAVPLAVALPDPLLMEKPQYLLYALLVPLGGISLTLAVPWLRTRSPLKPAVLLVGLGVCVFVWTDLEQTAGYTTSNSWSEYGEEGFSDTVDFLERHVGDAVPVIRKDLAYALQRERPERRLEWIYTAALRRDLREPGSAAATEELFLQPGVEWVVVDRYCRSVALLELLGRHFELVEKFGDFQIFGRSSLASGRTQGEASFVLGD